MWWVYYLHQGRYVCTHGVIWCSQNDLQSFWLETKAETREREICVLTCTEVYMISVIYRLLEMFCSYGKHWDVAWVWPTSFIPSVCRVCVCVGTEDRRLSYECNSKPVCPAKCRCEANVVDCSNLRLTKFPEHLPSSTEELWDTK